MQMRRLYTSTNRKVRAEKLRASAHELARCGFLDFAFCARQEADILDPPPLETLAEMKARQHTARPRQTATASRVPHVRPSTPSTRPDPVARAQRAAQNHPARITTNTARPTPITPFRARSSRAVGIR